MVRERKDPKIRKASILLVAVELAKDKGYLNLKRLEVAEQAGIAESLIDYYFGSMHGLKKEIMREAIRLEIHTILLQGLAANCSIADRAPQALKAKAVAKYSTTVTL